jgi:hypothetical protein
MAVVEGAGPASTSPTAPSRAIPPLSASTASAAITATGAATPAAEPRHSCLAHARATPTQPC